MRRIAKIALLTALSAAACSRAAEKPSDTGIPDKKFIAVMVELGSAGPAEKSAVLRKHGVSDKQLRAFIQAHADRPKALGAVFDSIQTALDRNRAESK